MILMEIGGSSGNCHRRGTCSIKRTPTAPIRCLESQCMNLPPPSVCATHSHTGALLHDTREVDSHLHLQQLLSKTATTRHGTARPPRLRCACLRCCMNDRDLVALGLTLACSA